MRHASRRTGALLLVLSVVFAPVWAEDREAFRGRPLVEVLEELRSRGLVLIYSTAVVPEDLVVTVEPEVSDLRDALAQLLAPLGLEAREGPAGSVVIAPAPSPPADRAPMALAIFTTEIVVTPGLRSLLEQDREASRRFDPADILRVPNIGSDVSRMVERVPGVAAADNSAAFHARGSLEGDTSLVLDGLELYAPYHLPAFQAPFSLIDSRVADRVELRSGGFTAERGDRHGAFLDVATIVPTEAHGEVEVGTLNSRVSYGTPVAGGRGSFLASVRAWYPEAFLDTLELGAGERLRPRFEDVYGKFGWSTSSRTFLSVHALLARDRLRWEERGEEDPEIVDAETESGYAWLRLLASVSERATTETIVSGGRIDSSRTGIAVPDDGVVTLDDEREMRFFGLTEDAQWRIGRSQVLRAGFAVRHLSANYRYANVFRDDPAATTTFTGSPAGISWGLYVSHRARISPTVATELGVRWDRQQYTDDSQLCPRFHLLWRPGEASELRFAVGRYAQSQRIHELRVEDGETSFRPAEIARQVELTFLHEFPGGPHLRVDAYDRKLSDLRPRYENLFQPLDLFPETSEDRVTVAPSKARLRGVELLFGGDPERSLLWWVSYTRASAEDRIDGAFVPRSWDQPHAGKFLVGYRWGDAWLVSLAGTVHTGWPTTPVSAFGTEQPDGSVVVETGFGPRNSARFPGYGRLDLKVRRAFAVGRGRLSVTLDVINVTDRKNICCVDDLTFGEAVPGPVGVSPEYSSWLGITPTLQGRWEF